MDMIANIANKSGKRCAMSNKQGLIVILLLGATMFMGCTAATIQPVKSDTAPLPLNKGVKDLLFLSSEEIEILQTVNRVRIDNPASGPLQPLKASTGLSFSAKKRAEELAHGTNTGEGPKHLFELVQKFGTWKGGVAEVVSQGYSGSNVVTEFMKNSREQPYFMEKKYNVMGAGCTPEGRPAPICVIILAVEFTEVR